MKIHHNPVDGKPLTMKEHGTLHIDLSKKTEKYEDPMSLSVEIMIKIGIALVFPIIFLLLISDFKTMIQLFSSAKAQTLSLVVMVVSYAIATSTGKTSMAVIAVVTMIVFFNMVSL